MDELLCNTKKTDQMGFNFLDPKEKYLWSKINTSLFTQILETQKQKKMHYVGFLVLIQFKEKKSDLRKFDTFSKYVKIIEKVANQKPIEKVKGKKAD